MDATHITPSVYTPFAELDLLLAEEEDATLVPAVTVGDVSEPETVDAFNAQSAGALKLNTRELKGQYEKEAFMDEVSSIARRGDQLLQPGQKQLNSIPSQATPARCLQQRLETDVLLGLHVKDHIHGDLDAGIRSLLWLFRRHFQQRALLLHLRR